MVATIEPATGMKRTAVRVREANLAADKPVIVDLIRKYLAADADVRRFEWLYLENPFGQARAWIACNQHDQAIGMAAVFSRRMYCDGAAVSGCVLGDFCVSPEYRSLGPALQLQRACLGYARSDEVAVAYDFPGAGMLGIYRHLGIASACESVRWVKMLLAGGLPRGRSIPRPLAAAANFTLSLGDHASAIRGVDFCLQDVACGAEYTSLAEKVGSQVGICTVRSAEYLNWRYRQHPSVKYEFLAARRNGELAGYCTFTQSSDSATIAELFADPEDDAMNAALLRKLASLLRARGIATLSFPLLSVDPRARLLRKVGFWARESVPVILLENSGRASTKHMLLMHGDRES